MLYLIDGYNVTMNDSATRGLSTEGQRDALLARLGARRRALLGKGDVIVVFDARAQMGLSSEMVSGIKAVYAPDADTEIVRRCAAAKGAIAVVTDDMRMRARISQDVSRRVEYRGSSTCFDAAGRGAARRESRPSVAREEGLPTGANEITEELKRVWGVED